MEWIDVKDQLPKSGVRVLFCFRNGLGKHRTALGIYAAQFTVESDPYLELFEDVEDEQLDEDGPYFRIEGWYEEPYESEYYYPISETVTHWASLPEAPNT